MADAFARAYKDGQWHNGSGSGSSEANTRAYRSFLQDYMASHDVRSVVDIGCGDWQFSRFIPWAHMTYTGIDVVPDVIRQNTLRYAKWAGDTFIQFVELDVLSDVWPLPRANLTLCKDLLQHWPDSAVQKLAGRLAGRRALITYDLGPNDGDTPPGGYRALDLTAPPFSWPVRERLRYASLSHEGTVARTKVVMELEGR